MRKSLSLRFVVTRCALVSCSRDLDGPEAPKRGLDGTSRNVCSGVTGTGSRPDNIELTVP